MLDSLCCSQTSFSACGLCLNTKPLFDYPAKLSHTFDPLTGMSDEAHSANDCSHWKVTRDSMRRQSYSSGARPSSEGLSSRGCSSATPWREGHCSVKAQKAFAKCISISSYTNGHQSRIPQRSTQRIGPHTSKTLSDDGIQDACQEVV